MSITIESIKNFVASTASNVYTKAAELKESVSSRLDHYIPHEKEVEKKTWTEREIQEMHWNTMTLEGPVGIKEWEAYNNIPREKEVEKKTCTEREIQEMHWNTMTLEEPVGIKEWEAHNNYMSNNNVISKVINIWNKCTGLTCLYQKLEKLSETHNIRLYKHTSKLLFKNSDNVVKKIVKILSSLFGITHLSLVTTLLINKLFPGEKKEPQTQVQPLYHLRTDRTIAIDGDNHR